jgi:hypothetical protein
LVTNGWDDDADGPAVSGASGPGAAEFVPNIARTESTKVPRPKGSQRGPMGTQGGAEISVRARKPWRRA